MSWKALLLLLLLFLFLFLLLFLLLFGLPSILTTGSDSHGRASLAGAPTGG